jgi:hypothetical protein
MDDEEASVVLMAASCVALACRKKPLKRRRRFWIHPIVRKRPMQGDFYHLVSDLRKDPVLFKRYFRMNVQQFDYLLDIIRHRINLQNTRWRRSIEPEQQLAICLRLVFIFYYVKSSHLQMSSPLDLVTRCFVREPHWG